MHLSTEAAVASVWAAQDPQGAASWVASLPPGPERDRSATSLVLAVAERLPRDAWDWALTISDSGQRDQAAGRVAQVVAARDPATARQWVQAGPFTPETKAKFMAEIEKQGPSTRSK